jgi:hypothetical protein
MLFKRNGNASPWLSVSEFWSDPWPYCMAHLLKFASVALVLFLVAGAWAQDMGKATEPGSPSVPVKLDSSGQLVPLESEVVRIKRKFHAWGFSGVTAVYQVEGEKSRVRLKAEGKPEFVVRLEGKVDPLEAVQFYHFEELDGSRAVPIVDFDILNRMSNFQVVHATVDFNAVRYGTSSFKLIPLQALVPGEYCLLIKPINKSESKSPGFCFGINAAGN